MSLLDRFRRIRLVTALIETFGFSPWLATAVALFFFGLATVAACWLVLSAPPRSITIAGGPPGSSFQERAEKYRDRLAAKGLTLNIVSSSGSLDNLHRLTDPASGVDIGFVQGGLVGEKVPPGLMSLGSLSYQPLWIFYRGAAITRLAELAGRRLGIGAPGSGGQALARALLEANKITGAPTELVEKPSDQAAKDFQAGRLDALFLAGDSAPNDLLKTLIRQEGVRIFSFAQAEAYVRRFTYLNKIVIPQGALDFAENLPAQDVVLLSPTVELIAHDDLNSAVSDALLAVAQEVQPRSNLIAKRGEFPAPLAHEYPISDDALRYYKSGRGFTYKLLDKNFWLANLINRLLVAIIPIVLVVIPAIRFMPVAYRWSVQIRIYRCYRPLLKLERDAGESLSPPQVDELLQRLDEIEHHVHALKVPASFASQFYDLRNHVVFVRNRLQRARG